MTSKRFIIDDAGSLIDMNNRNTYDYVSDVCELLNELHEENEQLKFQLDECQNHKLYSRRELEKENEQLKKEILWWKYRCGEDISGDVE